MGVVLFELFALRSLFTEDETMAAIDEVVLSPTPDLVARLPEVDPAMQRIISAAIAKEPEERPSAAALGRALDAWAVARGQAGSPDRLQTHLNELFPEAPPAPAPATDPASISLLPSLGTPPR